MPNFAKILADCSRQIDWLYSLVTDPTGSRYFLEKSPETRRREFVAQLARTADFLEFAGNPHTRFNSIHVAGTSGKGSVTTMLAAMLTAGGWRTGLHTSPYLQICNEKLIINGQMISPSAFTALVRRLSAIHAEWQQAGRAFADLRYGEAWVSLTYLWFAGQQVDWAVVETSLGGRFDPTNVLPAQLAVITNVNFDHVKILGPDLLSIARHKAGIIKPGGLAITAETNPATLAVIQAEAAAKQATLYLPGRDFSFAVENGRLAVQTPFNHYTDLVVALPGEFQVANAALAVAGLDVLAARHGLPLTAAAIKTGLAGVKFPGRLEVMPAEPLVILDGAHNPHKMQALVTSLRQLYPAKRIVALFGMIRDKDTTEVVKVLAPQVSRFIVTAPNVFGKPALPPNELANIIKNVAPLLKVEQAASVKAGVELALQTLDPDELLLATGSLYLVGEARDHWFPRENLLQQLESAPQPRC